MWISSTVNWTLRIIWVISLSTKPRSLSSWVSTKKGDSEQHSDQESMGTGEENFEGVTYQCKKNYKCSNKTSMSELKVVEQNLMYDEHVYD